ncbi:MAG: DUF2330 domain-containing protein [Hadesarchaea archaeon]|nr:DUF2330 domain-containing protein [Hadesarchaea archaeon]MDH5685652.1 DUF2330 domain-containing protein [Hadesarchaea archaeon]
MRKSYFWFFVSLLILATLPTVAADRGMWIPSEVDVYGPGQKAIIAWDGEQEILILSTDVYVSPQSLEGLGGRWAVVSESTHENVWTLTLLDIYRGRPENRGKLMVTPFDQHLSENIWVLVPSLLGNPSAGIQSLEEVKDGIVWKLKPLEECIPRNLWEKIWTLVALGDGGWSECGATLEEIFLPEWWSTYFGQKGISLPYTREKVWALEPLDTKGMEVRSWVDFAISSTRFTLAGENIEVWNWTLAPLHWSFVKENFQVLEFLPLPSLPEVEKGSFESFAQIQRLIMEHAPELLAPTLGPEGRGGVEIVFHERIGAHDVTIVKVTNASEFITWAENFLNNQNVEHGVPPERLEAIVDTYLQRGMSYFVFDLIEVGLSPHSIDPLIYRFQSDFLYYPLEISSLVSGTTSITLFTLTHDDIDEHYAPEDSIEVRLGFEVSENELQLIDPEIAELFHGSARLTVLTYNGALEILKGDLMLSAKVDQLLAAAWAAAVILILLGIFAIIYKLSPYYKTGPPS